MERTTGTVRSALFGFALALALLGTAAAALRVEVQPMDQFVSVGETVRLICNVSGSEPISYQWLRDGEQLQDGGSSVLSFIVSYISFGEYQCNASNDMDQVLSEVAVLTVSPSGSVVVIPPRQTLSINDNATFMCLAQGGPGNVFQWSFGSANLTGENGSTLNVPNVDAADGGAYTCTVSNRAGMDMVTAVLFVNPILLEEPVDTNICLFENRMLTCRARGFPTPEVSWYQNGTRLDAAAVGNGNITAVVMNRDTISTLTITNATFDTSGRYFCSVTSSDPNVIMVNSSEVDVNVQHAINVTLSPMEDPVTYLFKAARANNTIMLSCSWDEEAYFVAWLRDGIPFYGEDRVRGVDRMEYESFSGSTSVTADFAARWSTLQITEAFINDSANYTCAVTCRARQGVRGEVLQVSEEFSATREVLVLAAPVGLMATVRRPMYLFVEWTAPPSPFSGNYRLTYGPLGGTMASTTVSGTSYNITGLMPFTNYRVAVEASNAPVVEFGPTLSGVFATLPDAAIPPAEDPPTLVVPQVRAGSSGIVEILFSSPSFQRQYFLSHLWVVCIRNVLTAIRNTAPDTAFPDNSTFGTYDSAEDNVPYIASEFDAEGIIFPYTFGVGNESEPNDFPNQYRNGPVMAGRNLDCFVRYFVSTEVMPPARRRRDAIPNRQYDIFQSTGYSTVNIVTRSFTVQTGLIAGGVVCAVIVAVTIPVVIAIFIYTRKQGKGKYVQEEQMDYEVTLNGASSEETANN